jgi:hypothetical protein
VPDLAIAAARVRSLGYDIMCYSDESPDWKECFLHPRRAQGIVIQLAESHLELEPEEMRALAFPASPEAPDAPLRIAVDVDPATPEGPVAIEIAAPLPRALPEGPHPVLGAPFVAALSDALSPTATSA